MENEKVKYLINMINDMDLTNKIRLAICMSDSSFTNLKYDKYEMYTIFDNMLKEIDEEYRTTLINFAKYHLIMQPVNMTTNKIETIPKATYFFITFPPKKLFLLVDDIRMKNGVNAHFSLFIILYFT